MAKYSDNRETNREMKYLYKVWSGVDSQIKLPASLTGSALLHLIEDIPAPVEEKTEKQARRKIMFSPRFTWRSGATYAAALVLIVALSALLGRGNPNPELVGGTVPAEAQQEAEAAQYNIEDEATQADAAEPRVMQAQEDIEQSAQADAQASSVADTPEGTPSGSGEEQSADTFAASGVGGPSESVLLSEDGTYTYTYRYNDVNDPDKAGVPITVNIVHTSSGALAFEIDLAYLHTLDAHVVYGQTLVLIGQSESGDTLLAAYDLALVGEPECILELDQLGRMIAVNEYKSFVYLTTFAPAGIDPGCEVIDLPEATGEELCVLTALDLDTMETVQLAYLGAGEDISLYNLNAYLQYEGEVDEEHEQGRYIAHIRLDGLQIELRDVQ